MPRFSEQSPLKTMINYVLFLKVINQLQNFLTMLQKLM